MELKSRLTGPVTRGSNVKKMHDRSSDFISDNKKPTPLHILLNDALPLATIINISSTALKNNSRSFDLNE